MYMIGDEYLDQAASYLVRKGKDLAIETAASYFGGAPKRRRPTSKYRRSANYPNFKMNYRNRKRKALTQGQRGYARKSGFYGRFQGPFSQESKFLDVDVTDAIVATGGFVVDTLHVIAQGTTESQRIGRKVVISKIMFKYSFDLPLSTIIGNTADVLRLIIFVDRQCNGAAATITDILNEADVRSFRNLENSARFRILLDRTEQINATGSGDGAANDVAPTIRFRRWFKDCSIPIEFDSTTGAITEIKSNNISMLVVSDTGLVGFNAKVRLRYKG